MLLKPPRLTVTYWPAWSTRRAIRPILGLHRTPAPDCLHCDGTGYTGDDPEGIDETECACAPFEPIIAIPLPKRINRHYRRQKAHRAGF